MFFILLDIQYKKHYKWYKNNKPCIFPYAYNSIKTCFLQINITFYQHKDLHISRYIIKNNNEIIILLNVFNTYNPSHFYQFTNSFTIFSNSVQNFSLLLINLFFIPSIISSYCSKVLSSFSISSTTIIFPCR